MKLGIATIRKFAPILKIHPDEKYYPMDPMRFICDSRFRHHRAGAKDQGYHKGRKKWVESFAKAKGYYDVPASFIQSFGLWRNCENRRPRDGNNGNAWNVFLQPNGKPKGERAPDGVVPVFYTSRSEDSSKISKQERNKYAIKQEKCHKIQYWWFMGYNDGPLLGGLDAHQGDWEHVTVKLKNGVPDAVYFSAHGEPTKLKPSDLSWSDDHPIVYCAIGSHASYPRAGRFPLLGRKLVDETRAGGTSWSTAHCLASVKMQPWRSYAGAWGKVGEFAHTTGPLGPWHKRYKN